MNFAEVWGKLCVIEELFILLLVLTDLLEYSSPWGTDCCLASQEINNLWNQVVCYHFYKMNSLGFWWWFVAVRILEFLGFIHCQVFFMLLENTKFWEVDLFLSSGVGQGQLLCLMDPTE